MTDSSTIHSLLLRRRHGLLRLLFGAVDILALVVHGSHHRLSLLGDKWLMASWTPSLVYMESPASIPKSHTRPF
jgi:hypothetical protein